MLLTGIAVADMSVMLEYIPFTLHMYILNYKQKEEQVKTLGLSYSLGLHFSIMKQMRVFDSSE